MNVNKPSGNPAQRPNDPKINQNQPSNRPANNPGAQNPQAPEGGSWKQAPKQNDEKRQAPQQGRDES